jgi:Domain of unknown function (DUF4383)
MAQTQTAGVLRTRSGRPLACSAALAVGVVFLITGIAGFIPGITTHYGGLTFAGHNSMAKLLGVFQVSVLHNIVHLLYGVVGVALARRFETARLYLVGGGIIYLVLWLYGVATDNTSRANFVPMNTADDWLHLALGVGMIFLGLLTGQRAAPAARG